MSRIASHDAGVNKPLEQPAAGRIVPEQVLRMPLHRPQEPRLRRIKRLDQAVRCHRHRLQPRRQLPHRLVMEGVDGKCV